MRLENMDVNRLFTDDSLAVEYATVCGVSCGHEDEDGNYCDSENVELTGVIETDGCGGFFVYIKCHKCGEYSEDGDGDFFKYFAIDDGGIYRIGEDRN